jgi:hypothetical protein
VVILHTYSSASEFFTLTVPNRTVIFLLERAVSMGHRLPYRTVFFIFRKARAQPLETLNITDFQKREPYRYNLNTIFRFMVKKREPYRNKNKSVFQFQFPSRTVPY